jgi:hypothetical protein
MNRTKRSRFAARGLKPKQLPRDQVTQYRTKEKIMSEEKPVPTDKADELSESEIARISGGLNPQPLPPSPPPELDRF